MGFQDRRNSREERRFKFAVLTTKSRVMPKSRSSQKKRRENDSYKLKSLDCDSGGTQDQFSGNRNQKSVRQLSFFTTQYRKTPLLSWFIYESVPSSELTQNLTSLALLKVRRLWPEAAKGGGFDNSVCKQFFLFASTSGQ